MPATHDYYETLKVDRKASSDEIKKSYRRLARKYHPDLNPGDKAAEDRFKKLQEAYDVLSEPKKRQMYDQQGFYSDSGSLPAPDLSLRVTEWDLIRFLGLFLPIPRWPEVSPIRAARRRIQRQISRPVFAILQKRRGGWKSPLRSLAPTWSTRSISISGKLFEARRFVSASPIRKSARPVTGPRPLPVEAR